MAWMTTKYQKRRLNDDSIVLSIRVQNDARNESYEVDVDPNLTEDEILNILAAGIKEMRVNTDSVDGKLNTTTLEAKINTLP